MKFIKIMVVVLLSFIAFNTYNSIASATSACMTHQLSTSIIGGASPKNQVPQGSVHTIGSFNVPDELVGQTATFILNGENSTYDSIHLGNDVRITTGGSSTLAFNVESSPNPVVEADRPLVLGNTVTYEVIIGPDGVWSAGLTSFVTCLPVVTTTTTVPETTTTVPETTTTVSETTSTTVVSTTSVDPTTTIIPTVPTTVPPVCTDPSCNKLPETGMNANIALIGLATLLSGIALISTSRRKQNI